MTAYDSPIYIADAAVYLKATQPDLEIEDPARARQKQFDAAVELLKKQRTIIGEYWSDYTKQIAAFTGGESVVGTTWQVITNVLKGEKVPVEAVLPKEGSTGWSDTWMISSKAKNPNCMYLWMNHIISPEANAAATEYFGEAPSSRRRATSRPTRTTARLPPTTRSTSSRSTTGRRRPTAATTAARSARTTRNGRKPGRVQGVNHHRAGNRGAVRGSSPGRRLSTFLFRHSRLRVGLLLTPPLSWLLLAYLAR